MANGPGGAFSGTGVACMPISEHAPQPNVSPLLAANSSGSSTKSGGAPTSLGARLRKKLSRCSLKRQPKSTQTGRASLDAKPVAQSWCDRWSASAHGLQSTVSLPSNTHAHAGSIHAGSASNSAPLPTIDLACRDAARMAALPQRSGCDGSSQNDLVVQWLESQGLPPSLASAAGAGGRDAACGGGVAAVPASSGTQSGCSRPCGSARSWLSLQLGSARQGQVAPSSVVSSGRPDISRNGSASSTPVAVVHISTAPAPGPGAKGAAAAAAVRPPESRVSSKSAPAAPLSAPRPTAEEVRPVVRAAAPATVADERAPPPSLSRTASSASSGSSKVIVVADHCPAELRADVWNIDDYALRRKWHEGGLSVVFGAVHRASGSKVAIKIYKRSRLGEMARFQLAREICLHARTVHPAIIQLYAAWKDARHVYLVLEWAPFGSLYDVMLRRGGGALPEPKAAASVARPLLSALAQLHAAQVIHRDVKLENVLVGADGCVKLADFGLAIDRRQEPAITRLGTYGYFAPEVLDCPVRSDPFEGKPPAGEATSADTSSLSGSSTFAGYDCKVDIWSAGVLMYEVLTGRAPFAASTPAEVIKAVRTRPLEIPASLSPAASDFLSCALRRCPAERATATELLQHPWLLQAEAAADAGSTDAACL